jgi:hypothetical protein
VESIDLAGKRQPEPQESWLCFTCREGLWVTHRTTWQSRGKGGNGGPGYFLPDLTLTSDRVLQEPPLSLTLTDREIAEVLTPHQRLAVAATSFGPPQDKLSNEDFALSAVIQGPECRPWAFATVADGVSIKTFWAARASRLSALAAFRVVSKAVHAGFGCDDQQLNDLREKLVRELRETLRRDQEILKESVRLYPQGWDPNLYKSFIKNDTYWYNSTLLVACIGPVEGFLLWAGDGGICVAKTPGRTAQREVTLPLRSTEDMTVDTFVSLGVASDQFRVARISYPAGVGKVEVFLASDGVDRTLQREFLSYEKLPALTEPSSARNLLQELAARPGGEVDNYSLARLTGPPPKTFQWVPSPIASACTTNLSRVREEERVPVPSPPAIQVKSSAPSIPAATSSTEVEPVSAETMPRSRRAKTEPRLLIIGFVVGLIVGLTIDRIPFLIKRRDGAKSPRVVEAPRQKPGLQGDNRNPGNAELNSSVTASPILIMKDQVALLDTGNMPPALIPAVKEWAKFLELQASGKRFSIVVYAKREKLNNRRNCELNARIAESRAKTFAHYLGMAATLEAKKRFDPRGRFNVCTPPAGVVDLRSDDARRAVLIDMPPDCKCSLENN